MVAIMNLEPHTSYHGDTTELTLPGFEGAEKRFEVDFYHIAKDTTDITGLRRLSRAQLDEICILAECSIVSTRTNASFDSYVLSESSMFVFPTKFVIKTCGTTKLLQCADRLLELAADVGLQPLRAKFSRCTYKYPDVQPAPHRSFEQERQLLDSTFGSHLGVGCAHVLGDGRAGLQWHVWLAQRANASTVCPANFLAPRATLEVCMTALAPSRAAIFCKDSPGGSSTSKACTLKSGIRALLPRSDINDFLFEPCGYSMNALEGEGFANSHVTPEAGFSYASIEVCGYADMDVLDLVEQIAAIFQPGQLAVAVHLEAGAKADDADFQSFVAGTPIQLTNTFGLRSEQGGVSVQRLADGSVVAFHRFRSDAILELNAAAIQADMVNNLKRASSEVSSECSDDRLQSSTPPPNEGELARSNSVYFDAIVDENPAAKKAKISVVTTPDAAILEAVRGFDVKCIGPGKEALDKHLLETFELTDEDAFYVVDLGKVLSRYQTWVTSMPRVEPFYAVKCFMDPALLQTLAAAGCSFDCASPVEMEAVLSMGVGPERIVYANACKPIKHLLFAKQRGVRAMTFDNETELHKVQKIYPEAEMILRLRADDPAARCPLGDKYGAEAYEVEHLLRVTQQVGLNLKGISFHVGSGATDPNSFKQAILVARKAFDMAKQLGMPPLTLLDIGGGFSGGVTDDGDDESGGVVMERVAESINAAIDEFFPVSEGVRVISEPGRYFAEASATLCASVFGRRIRPQAEVGEEADTHAYWITDGLYGSFNCLLYDHAVVTVRTLEQRVQADTPLHKSTLFGPTCDGLDTILRGVPLPPLECGDWVVFDRMGAYTISAGGKFNGFDFAAIKTYYTFSR